MPKVNLINPPCPGLDDPKAYPHLGLLYLGAALRDGGYTCNYVDLSDKTGQDYTIPEADYHLITVVESTYRPALEVRSKIDSGKVVVGGFQPSLRPLQAFIDFKAPVVTGEAEERISSILYDIKYNSGIPCMKYDCGVVEDLNSIAFPDRDLIPRDVLRNTSGRALAKYSGDGAATSIISSRGCPYHCSFCSKLPLNDHFRYRSADNVVSEMKEVREKYDICHFKFWDECFTLRKGRMNEICNILIEDGGFYWMCMTRTNTITPQMLHSMYAAGCREMQVGIESGSQKVLDAMCKGTTVERNVEAIQWIKDAGIKAKLLMMEGHPSETIKEDVDLTKKFIENTT